jgi:hypothetical protein
MKLMKKLWNVNLYPYTTSDGISEKEARIIGNYYLLHNAIPLHTGHHPAAIGEIIDTDKYWKGSILMGTIAGMLPIPWIEPLYIDKNDGTVKWEDEGITQSEVKERSNGYMKLIKENK